MNPATLAVLISAGMLFLVFLTHTAILFRWGSRLQLLVEQHETQLNGEHGLRRWKHDVVTPDLVRLRDHLLDEPQPGKGR